MLFHEKGGADIVCSLSFCNRKSRTPDCRLRCLRMGDFLRDMLKIEIRVAIAVGSLYRALSQDGR